VPGSTKRTLRGSQAPDYQALIETAGDLIYMLDLQGRFTFLNPAAERVLGYTLPETLGRPFTEFLTAEGGRVALAHFSQGLSGTDYTPFFEVEARRKHGGTVHLEIRAGSLLRDGKLVGRQGIARDITELKALQARIVERSERLALLEERTRIAMGLYARMLELTREDASDPDAPGQALKQMNEVVMRISAEKVGLTVADQRILELLSKGLSNREIAAAVHRSPNTIKDQLKKIMQRLGVKRRAEAVATALSSGLIARER
jgi:PAS domain S-box-containing protein